MEAKAYLIYREDGELIDINTYTDEAYQRLTEQGWILKEITTKIGLRWDIFSAIRSIECVWGRGDYYRRLKEFVETGKYAE